MSNEWITNYVNKANFTGLFVEELGWERVNQRRRTVSVEVNGETLTLTPVAGFRGITIWVCPFVPSGQGQRTVDKALRKESAERVIIFHDETRQLWCWPQTRDTAGAGTPRLVPHEHILGKQNEALRQRLQFIKIGIDEGDISVLEVVRRLRRAFDSDQVTKSFYSKFTEQHRLLTGTIKGIAVSDKATKPELRWYGSILLNRLMFIYFMQRKGFLDGDINYLRNRLDQIRELNRPGSFYEFYKDFLIPLFHEGLGSDAENRVIDDPAIEALIGDIPYINGGIFSRHPLEEANDIRVPDKSFEKIFDFFDQWQWHLDNRPSGKPNEINPDVLGYIFEQFVNNREEVSKGNKEAATNADKGAFYTKEDVTGYITSSTLIPVFLDQIVERTGVNPWQLLVTDPERYIWPSLRHGLEYAVPEAISKEASLWPRPTWDSLEVPKEVGLPGESWWEVMERRGHVALLIDSARSGAFNSASECVAQNLDLEELAIDVVDSLENPSDLVTAWETLSTIKVIDPTCGSGAFLFAALNILQGLYRAIYEAAVTHAKISKDEDLRALVRSANDHPNVEYFLLKHATLRNLYGVDIMPEAVEIARLRLFLKLIAQIDKRSEIEPLPDLEFNIRSGNALVGALNVDEIRSRVDLLNQFKIDAIEADGKEVAKAYRDFSAAQESGEHLEIVRTRIRLRELTSIARDQLDDWWHESDEPSFKREVYLTQYQPFHWFIEFPEVFTHGGFDVVVGNPPYVQKKKLDYSYSGFDTDKCPDIYAPCTERASQICSPRGRLGMIVMLSLSFSNNFKYLRRCLRERFPLILASTFSRRPSTLFTGVGVRNTIVICSPDPDSTGLGRVMTTDTRRWIDDYRPHLMGCLRYTDISTVLKSSEDQWLRTGDEAVGILLKALVSSPGSLGDATSRSGYEIGFKQTALYYLSVYVDEPPAYDSSLRAIVQPQVGSTAFRAEEDQLIASAVLAGRLSFAWWGLKGDDFHVNSGVLKSFPVDLADIPEDARSKLLNLAHQLRSEMPKALVYTLYAKKWLGNYDMKMLRHITDEVDEIVLQTLGLEAHLPTVRRIDARLFRSSGDAGNSIRTWPPPNS